MDSRAETGVVVNNRAGVQNAASPGMDIRPDKGKRQHNTAGPE